MTIFDDEIIFQDKIDEINEQIREIEKTIDDLKNQLKKATSENEIYEIKWELKDLCKLAKDKYRSLEIWSEKDQSDNYFKYLCNEIFFYESCLKMRKAKFGTEKIDYRHYLNVAYLENIYFLDNEYPKNFNEFQDSRIFTDIGVNMIVNNIHNALKNIEVIIEHNKNGDHKDLFIYYELLGDLKIHIFCYFLKSESIDRESLKSALFFYKISIWHKTQLERLNPQTYFDGLHGWESHGIFHDFYGKLDVRFITDVREKKEKLCLKYPLTQEENLELDKLLAREINGE